MLSNLTFSQRRVHTVGVGVLLSAVMLWATPVFAQELRHVAEVLKKTGSGPVSFGPFAQVPHPAVRRRTAWGANLLVKVKVALAKSWKVVMMRAVHLTGPQKRLFCSFARRAVLTMQAVIPRGFVLPSSPPNTGSSRTAAP